MRALLIGDSILNGYSNGPGYGRFVCESLSPVGVNVASAACSDSGSLLASLSKTIEGGPWDVIHFNCGLHDLKRDRVSGAVVHPSEVYAKHLTAIFDQLCTLSPKVVWATITPVHDVWHQTYKPFDRRQADVLKYNQTAFECASQHPIVINDLHAVISAKGHERLQHTDGVHFKEDGSRVLAEAVIAALL